MLELIFTINWVSEVMNVSREDPRALGIVSVYVQLLLQH